VNRQKLVITFLLLGIAFFGAVTGWNLSEAHRQAADKAAAAAVRPAPAPTEWTEADWKRAGDAYMAKIAADKPKAKR
jgi:hypothetical protein